MINQLSYNPLSKLNYNFYIYLIFCFLPISHILGNTILNGNIILCGLILLFYSIKNQDWDWINNGLFKWLLVLYFYLILNSLYAIFFKIDHEHIYGGLIRSLGFIKYIIFTFSFYVILKLDIKFEKIIKFWFLIVLIVIVDIFFEKYFGKNLIGNVSPNHTRIVSFFKDELVVGNFILSYGFIVFFYLISQYNIKLTHKFYLNFFLFLILMAVLFSGERSNFIKSILITLLFVSFVSNEKLIIKKINFSLIVIFALLSTYFLNENVKKRYNEFYKRISISEKTGFDKLENIKYFSHYKVAYNIFKDNPILGVGNKNFRWDCHKTKYIDPDEKFNVQRCSTHPHQIHFEILSEHGLLGYILIATLLIKYIFSKLRYMVKNDLIFEFSLAFVLLVFFTPFIPSGSLFSSYSGSFFWLILSILNYRLISLNKKKIIKNE